MRLDTNRLPKITPGHAIDLYAQDRMGGDGIITVGTYTDFAALKAEVATWSGHKQAWTLHYSVVKLNTRSDDVDIRYRQAKYVKKYK